MAVDFQSQFANLPLTQETEPTRVIRMINTKFFIENWNYHTCSIFLCNSFFHLYIYIYLYRGYMLNDKIHTEYVQCTYHRLTCKAWNRNSHTYKITSSFHSVPKNILPILCHKVGSVCIGSAAGLCIRGEKAAPGILSFLPPQVSYESYLVTVYGVCNMLTVFLH